MAGPEASPAGAGAPAEIVEAAPAKLNLYLHVVGRRPDGYHLLDSLVAFASVGDRVAVSPAADPAAPTGLAVTGPFAAEVPADGGNLAWQAAAALAAALYRPCDVAVRLDKALPVAAGIGGGSADAAAVLRACARLWGVAADAPLLTDIAAGLGADVPVCLAGRTRFVGGIGERLEPAPDVAGCPVVLVNPLVPLPTPAVFRARTGPFSDPARFAGAPGGPAGLAALLRERRNDLAAPARRLCPAVDTVLAALEDTGGCRLARLSGSGATCFGLYDDAGTAAAAAEALAAAHPGWWVRAGVLL
jgi:4-diphosphocytidyl-2-C-methyl-D-erythritol kinase